MCMHLNVRGVLMTFLFCSAFAVVHGQTAGQTSGEITVQLVQGFDSALNPKAVSQGRVIKTPTMAVPVGAQVLVRVQANAEHGGYTVKLLQIDKGGGPVLPRTRAWWLLRMSSTRCRRGCAFRGSPRMQSPAHGSFYPSA